MNIIVTTFGSLGDLHPFIALALSLKKKGADVTFISHPDYKEKLEQVGLRFASVGKSREEFAKDLGMDLGEFLEYVSRDIGILFDLALAHGLDESVIEIQNHINNCDLVVGSAYAYAGHIAAEVHNKPFVSCTLAPTQFMSSYDPPVTAEALFITNPRSPISRVYNRCVISAGQIRLYSGLNKISKVYRKYGLKPQTKIQGIVSNCLTLGLFSPLLQDIQPDFPPNSYIVGSTWFDSEDGRSAVMSPELETFLSRNSPPLVFSLGSTAVWHGEEFFKTSLNISKSLNLPCILLCGQNSSLLDTKLNDKCLAISYAPHSLLFPLALTVIQHGGIGSSLQALRSGNPVLTTPIFADQFDNGERIKKLGCGEVIPFKKYTLNSAGKVISTLISSEKIKENCHKVSEALRHENGADKGATIILKAFS